MFNINSLFNELSINPLYLFDETDELDYIKTHLLRFKSSIKYIYPILENTNNLLELGNKTCFCKIINYFFPNIKIDNTTEDLRYDFLTNINNNYDMILCMETIEHIKDREMEDDISNINNLHLESFVGDGIESLLRNCYRLLNSTGHLFLTTPNINGYYNIKKIMSYEHPFGYEPHPRELTYNNIKRFLNKTNFNIKLFDYIHCWNGLSNEEKQKIDEFGLLFSPEKNREDCIFCLTTK